MADSIFDAFETDADLSAGDGVRFDISQGSFHCAIWARSTDLDINPELRQVMIDAASRMAMSGQVQEEHELRPLFLAHAVTKWEGIFDRDGNPIPCTFKNRVELFEKLPKLAADLSRRTNNWRNFLARQADDIAGNSLPSWSNGSTPDGSAATTFSPPTPNEA